MMLRPFGVALSVAASLSLSCATPLGAEKSAAPPPEASGPPAAATPPASAPRQLEAETKLALPSGATFTAASGWFVTSRESGYLLEEPERELTLTVTESAHRDLGKAVALAWKSTRPDFARVVERQVNPPPSDGWDEVTQLNYEAAAGDERVAIALARRKGDTWYIATIEGQPAALGRRGAQTNNTILSLRLAGAEVESFAGKKAHALEGERLARFNAFVDQARKATGVPGAAIVVLQNGRRVLEQGYGEKALGAAKPVTPDTLFMIGSTTKSLTTLMMARLVDTKRLTWDTPVSRLMPTFALGDASATQKLQVRHTVCACTGLPRQDFEFLFEYANVTPERRIEGMKRIVPTTGFGETFQYSNDLVSAGGFVAALAAGEESSLGRAYDRAMQAEVFGPLGMKATTFDLARVQEGAHATPHGLTLEMKYVPLALSDEGAVASVRPAGGAWSSVRDMAKYVEVELARGKLPGGEPFVSETNLLARREPQVKINDEVSYGLGLELADDHGLKVIGHRGNTLGFSSDLFFLPEHDLGVVVLTNGASANGFLRAVRRRLIETLFDGRDEAAEKMAFELKMRADSVAKLAERVELNPGRAWLERWAGSYANERLGEVRITLRGEDAVLDAGEWKSRLLRSKSSDGTVNLMLADPPLTGLELTPAVIDGAPTLTLKSSQQRYVFNRR